MTNKYYTDLGKVTEFNEWKKEVSSNWNNIIISQEDEHNINNKVIDAGNTITVSCKVKLPNIDKDNIQVQVYCGEILDNGKLDNVTITNMTLKDSNDTEKIYSYEAKVTLKTGGNYGYTFRVMPQNKMLLDSENLDLVKWLSNNGDIVRN